MFLTTHDSGENHKALMRQLVTWIKILTGRRDRTQPVTVFCDVKGIAFGQLTTIVERYRRSISEKWHLQMPTIIFSALKEMYGPSSSGHQ